MDPNRGLHFTPNPRISKPRPRPLRPKSLAPLLRAWGHGGAGADAARLKTLTIWAEAEGFKV